MFCPECKSMLMSSGGQLKCRKCGYVRKIESSERMTREKKRTENEITIVDDEDDKVKTMPTIQIKCPKCENNLAIWWLRQLRAADESEVRFFRCNRVWPYLAAIRLGKNQTFKIRFLKSQKIFVRFFILGKDVSIKLKVCRIRTRLLYLFHFYYTSLRRRKKLGSLAYNQAYTFLTGESSTFLQYRNETIFHKIFWPKSAF